MGNNINNMGSKIEPMSLNRTSRIKKKDFADAAAKGQGTFGLGAMGTSPVGTKMKKTSHTAKCIYGKKGSYLHKAEIMGVGPAKRIGRLSGNAMAAFAILLLCVAAVQALPLIPRPQSDDGAPPDQSSSGPSRATSVVDVKLFLCSTGRNNAPHLGTTPPTGATSTQNLPIDLAQDAPLASSIEVAGKDTTGGGAGAKGMWIWFGLTGFAGFNQIAITIYQDDETVASATITQSGWTGIKRWDVPFVSGDGHVFPAGTSIKVRISASMPVTIITYNSVDSYLLLPLTSNPVSPNVATYYAAGKPTSEFQPYWPDSVRRIRTEGEIASVFGPSDLARVLVTIRNPSGDIVSSSNANLTGTHYVNSWSYASGQIPGNYNITVNVTDRQGNAYYAYTVATMLNYGTYLSSSKMDADGVVKGVASPPRGGSEGTNMVYILDVLNSGYSATTVTVRVSSDPPPGWTASISPTSLPSIAPGSSVNVTFKVSPGAEVDYGNKAVIYVEAIADSDTRTPKASWTIQTVTNATMSRNFEFSIIGPSESWIDVGQTVGYQMLLRNKGVLDMNITLAIAGTPVAWSAQLDVSGMVHLDTGSNAEKTFNLRVTAPSEEVGNLSRVAQIAVTAQALEDSNLEKTVTTVTNLITILGLQVNTDVLTSDPDVLGGKVDLKVTINNLDPTNSHQVRLTVTAADWPISSLKYDPKESLLSPNGTTTITVSITPPSGTVANEAGGYPITIKIEPLDQPSRSNSTTVTLKVKQKYDISVAASQTSKEMKPGEKISLTLTVKNLGNGNDNIIVYVAAGIPQDWQVHLNDVLSPPNPLTVQLAPAAHPGDTQTINLTIKPPDSSRDGTAVNVTITAKSPKGPEKSVGVKILVKKDLMGRFRDVLINDQLGLFMFILTFFVIGTTVLVWRRSKS
jgi:uncharacterized membrane protein